MDRLRPIMANIAVVFYWGWAAMMGMPVEELVAFHRLAKERSRA